MENDFEKCVGTLVCETRGFISCLLNNVFIFNKYENHKRKMACNYSTQLAYVNV